MDLQMAIDSTNHHTEAFPSSFYPRRTRPRYLAVEHGPTRDRRSLTRPRPPGRGSRTVVSWGASALSSRTPDGLLRGAADPDTRDALIAYV